jgi:secreted trypsin-like serine protease
MTTMRSRGVAVVAVGAAALALALMGATAGPAAAKPRAGKAVIGGYVASIAAWPYQAALTRKGRLHCGGSVIAPTKILTAAHCVDKFDPTQITVITGRAKLSNTSTGQELPVAFASIHPDYQTSLKHDVAVITLAAPTSAPAVRLPTPAQDALATKPGSMLRVAGWGARHPLGLRVSPVLKENFDRVRAPRKCGRVFRARFSSQAMICAQGSRAWKYRRAKIQIHQTACFGDSGGPLVTDAFGPAVEVGIVSYGSRICGWKRTPTVYARVIDALDFIQLAMAT